MPKARSLSFQHKTKQILDSSINKNVKKSNSQSVSHALGNFHKNKPFNKFKGNNKFKNKSKKPYVNKAAVKKAELEKQREQAKTEKEQRIAQYKKKRLEKMKIISKRTNKGQPLMKDRIQYLLKQIEQMKRTS